MFKLNPVVSGIISFCASSYIVAAVAVEYTNHGVSPADVFTAEGEVVEVNDANIIPYRMDDGAQLTITGSASGSPNLIPSSFTLNAPASIGVIISGPGSVLNSDSAAYNLVGETSNAIRIEGGGTGTLTERTSINIDGELSTGVLVNNVRSDLNNIPIDGSSAATQLTSSASIISSAGAANAAGYSVQNGASLILTPQSQLIMHGDDNIGISMTNGGSVTNNAAMTIDNGIGLDVNGSGAAQMQGGTINVTTGDAGVRVSDGGQLALNNATINSAGTANGVWQLPDAAGITATNTIINTSGSGAGFFFSTEDGSLTDADLNVPAGFQINVQGDAAMGISANTTGRIENHANVNINNAAGGPALFSANSGEVFNDGLLQSQSTEAPVVNLLAEAPASLENHGRIVSLSTDSATPAVVLMSESVAAQVDNYGTIAAADPGLPAIVTGEGNDTISLLDGDVVGDINTGDGDDTLQWTGGSLNGSLTLGAGERNLAQIQGVNLDNTRHITSEAGGEGSDNTLILESLEGRGGSFDEDDPTKGVNLGNGWNTIYFANSQWTLTDDLTTAGSEVNIDSGSTLFAGNSVNPFIHADVNNSGTIDLTNGSGSPGNVLSVDGNLNSTGGVVKLQTRFNQGGALSNQFTDNLQIFGDATGTTLLDITPASQSTGASTDTNASGSVDNNEGISVAQVIGSANANSFALQGGYAAVGPWRYNLYSFAPGNSDASQSRIVGIGDQFWDYRLANSFINEDGSTGGTGGRPQVIPQVPSYISAPVGLAYYTTAIVDDLHKRLGELRRQQTSADNPDNLGGEMFLRYIGSNLEHKTNLDFTNFGYDLDIDYNAVQVGGNVIRLDGASDSLRGGLAYTLGHTRLSPHAADGFSRTAFDSNSVSLYGTWLRDNGFYVDGSLSMDWHRGDTDISRERKVGKIKARGWSTSVETGYPFMLQNDFQLEPQAQITYLRLNMDDFTDHDGTTVKYDSYSQTIGRLGARLDRSWSDNGGREYTPWLRVNYYKGWGGAAKTTIGAEAGGNSVDYTFDGGRFGQMWETGVGGSVSFKGGLALYTEADYRKELGDSGTKGWRYSVGLRGQF
ncbi:outer membrane autotransporter protein [Erwinia toletana]|uniref:Outer membrane autotransporter protein n=1 Tax=Winslowiella toletana TaxID=92490 RepID=A0ABS4P9R6_9GAMM|nr:autotransporter outer membrane beta-barrel domain-containing protein [Winslowiella toletana]MBP2169385.1 outer membrane autotransporter protein [Winslowiella toletana]